MSRKTDFFRSHASAVNVLKEVFTDRHDALISGEIAPTYGFNTDLDGIDWIKKNLLTIVNSFSSTKFQISIKIEVHDFSGEFSFRKDADTFDDLICRFRLLPVVEEIGPYPINASVDYEKLKKDFNMDIDKVNYKNMHEILNSLRQKGVEIKLKLNIKLNKMDVQDLFLEGMSEYTCPNIIIYLFWERFLAGLEDIRIGECKNEFFRPDKKNVIIILDFSGNIENDFLAIFGNGSEARIDNLITDIIPEKEVQKYGKIIELRKSHTSGDFSTNFVPEMFAIENNPVMDNSSNTLVDQLKSVQAILSTIYLAGRVDLEKEKYSIKFNGIKPVKFSIERTNFLEFKTFLPDVYDLYKYSYDGLSVDKLELAEQLTSLIIDNNIESLCKKAKNIEGAVKSAYDDILLGRTREYFESRQNVHDAINTSIKDTSDSIVDLTKDTSKEVYTIAGIIILGLIGTALNPGLLGLWLTSLIISLIISIYMVITICYYLETLYESQKLKLEHHNAYVDSFRDILGNKTTDEFINNTNMKNSNDIFLKKLDTAKDIYSYIFVAALLTAYISLYILVKF